MTAIAYIPYGAYWCTPFTKWQGALSHLHSLRFAAWHAGRELEARGWSHLPIDFAALGTTVPQQGAFFALPWVAGLMGRADLTGPTVAQACATSARIVAMARDAVSAGSAHCALVLAADRVSNGPALYYPDPTGPGGNGSYENWVLDNFQKDPFIHLPMLQTAENVARQYGISTSEQNDVTLHRYTQYQDALANDYAFQRRYMRFPFEVPDKSLRRIDQVINGDQGIHNTTMESLKSLRPVMEGGTVTFGGQTHPADGNAAMFICSAEKARQLSVCPEISIEILSTGQARVEKGYMPAATAPAARDALAKAGLAAEALTHIKTHNPFVVTDIVVARELKFPVEKINGYGSSLVWGHPQGPTGLRSLIELIEQMVIDGGGIGLFTGCAAGDSAMSVVLRVTDTRGKA